MKTTNISKAAVSGLQSGDAASFEDIFVFYYPRVRKFISLLTKQDDQACEKAREVFINVWSNREQVTSPEKFRMMLYDLTREAVVGIISADREAQESFVFDGNDPESEAKMLIEMLVEAMPQTQKEIYRMNSVDGKDTAQIAQSLKMPEKQVQKQLRKAISEVRSVLSVFVGLLA